MDQSAVLLKLEGIFRDIFGDDEIKLTRETTGSDIDDWDSVNNINIVVAIEEEFQMKLNISEIKALKNVGGMVDLIVAKKG